MFAWNECWREEWLRQVASHKLYANVNHLHHMAKNEVAENARHQQTRQVYYILQYTSDSVRFGEIFVDDFMCQYHQISILDTTRFDCLQWIAVTYYYRKMRTLREHRCTVIYTFFSVIGSTHCNCRAQFFPSNTFLLRNSTSSMRASGTEWEREREVEKEKMEYI